MSAAPGSPADHRNVALTTFRRSGEGVTCPVWIVDLGDGRVAVTTEDESGKVKRVRHDGRVELAPCDSRGNVPAGAPSWVGRATVVDGAESDRIYDLVKARYRLMAVGISLLSVLRPAKKPRVGLVIELEP